MYFGRVVILVVCCVGSCLWFVVLGLYAGDGFFGVYGFGLMVFCAGCLC